MSGKKRKGSGAGVNLAINLTVVSIVFIFFGYLMGQYALNAINARHHSVRSPVEVQSTTPVTATAPPPPASPPQSQQQPQSPPSVEQERSDTNGPLYRVQVGVFSEKANADRMVEILKKAGHEAVIISGPPFRVQTGAFSSETNAERLREELIGQGFEAIIVR